MNETLICDYASGQETNENGNLLGSVAFKPTGTMIIIAAVGIAALLWHNLFGIIKWSTVYSSV